jgi:hypothetical protein
LSLYYFFSKKLKKAIRSPQLFLRDFFLKRVPLEWDADINRKTRVDHKCMTTPRAGRSRKSGPPTNKIRGSGPKVETILSGYVSFGHDVDAVVTWVDGSDPEFTAKRQSYSYHDSSGKIAANNVARYQSHDEIRYCVRSIQQFAPWIRTIYIVTNGQVPNWFNPNQSKVKIVFHDEIIPAQYLPTFNSHVIESCLHRINGLSEHFVYFNDDVMLLRPLSPTDLFTETGLMRGFVSSATISNSPPTYSDTPSMTAIKNARILLAEKTGYYLSPKFAHTYHPQRKSVSFACEKAFAAEFHTCRSNKFRNTSDILCTSFLFPCYAYVNGHGVFSKLRAWYFNIRDVSAQSLYAKLLNLKGVQSGPLSVCLNDHLPDNQKYNFAEYEAALNAFLLQYYDIPFPCELSGIQAQEVVEMHQEASSGQLGAEQAQLSEGADAPSNPLRVLQS